MRIGLGFDAHAFADGRRLVLGGVELAHDRGLAGHSDADVLSHAIVDALLGAGGLGDIGTLFPSSDERWRDASSLAFIAQAVGKLRAAGLAVANVDATVICEAPVIGPYREQMTAALSDALGVSVSGISVKATTTDRMGFTGRGDGIAVVAIALVRPL